MDGNWLTPQCTTASYCKHCETLGSMVVLYGNSVDVKTILDQLTRDIGEPLVANQMLMCVPRKVIPALLLANGCQVLLSETHAYVHVCFDFEITRGYC